MSQARGGGRIVRQHAASKILMEDAAVPFTEGCQLALQLKRVDAVLSGNGRDSCCCAGIASLLYRLGHSCVMVRGYLLGLDGAGINPEQLKRF